MAVITAETVRDEVRAWIAESWDPGPHRGRVVGAAHALRLRARRPGPRTTSAAATTGRWPTS